MSDQHFVVPVGEVPIVSCECQSGNCLGVIYDLSTTQCSKILLTETEGECPTSTPDERRVLQECVCAGIANDNGEGDKCTPDHHHFGLQWCYIEPNSCDDSRSSNVLTSHHWSFTACSGSGSTDNIDSNNETITEEQVCIGTMVHVVTNLDGTDICEQWCHVEPDWCNGTTIENICIENAQSCLQVGLCTENGFKVDTGMHTVQTEFIINDLENEPITFCKEYDSSIEVQRFSAVCTCMGEEENGEGGSNCTSNFQGHPWCFVEQGKCHDELVSPIYADREWSFEACETVVCDKNWTSVNGHTT
eukprot:UN29023